MADRPQSSAMLLAEHSRLASLYQHNADMGDKYVSIYLTIVSAAAAFLAGLQRLAAPSAAIVSVELALFLVVLFVGVTTFARLLERRIHAIEYLRAINRIHRYYVDRDPEIQQYFYWPAQDDHPSMQIRGALFEGLWDTVAFLNSLVVALAVGALARYYLPRLPAVLLVLIGAIFGLVAWYVHRLTSQTVLRRAEERMG